mmetsp:Transcript_16193/g.50232  ORF Transcript_16193/g.50232 Transcript_16193/m.50232 type:complete len:249 (-) Transcript_16193:1216-1962(-)
MLAGTCSFGAVRCGAQRTKKSSSTCAAAWRKTPAVTVAKIRSYESGRKKVRMWAKPAHARAASRCEASPDRCHSGAGRLLMRAASIAETRLTRSRSTRRISPSARVAAPVAKWRGTEEEDGVSDPTEGVPSMAFRSSSSKAPLTFTQPRRSTTPLSGSTAGRSAWNSVGVPLTPPPGTAASGPSSHISDVASRSALPCSQLVCDSARAIGSSSARASAGASIFPVVSRNIGAAGELGWTAWRATGNDK